MINEGQELPEMDFHIHTNQTGMKCSFQPHNKMATQDILLCLALGIRGICKLIEEKTDIPFEVVKLALAEGLHAAFGQDIPDQIREATEQDKRDTEEMN